jgi:Zn-dependent M32 family carboxypeptidase
LKQSVTGGKLPSVGDVLRRFYYMHNEVGVELRAAASAISVKVMEFWEKARIPIKMKKHVIEKVKKLYKTWKDLRKLVNRHSSNEVKKRASFVATFNNLFDIAHQDAERLTAIKEDYEFLLAQREPGRRGTMLGIDGITCKKEKRKAD